MLLASLLLALSPAVDPGVAAPPSPPLLARTAPRGPEAPLLEWLKDYRRGKIALNPESIRLLRTMVRQMLDEAANAQRGRGRRVSDGEGQDGWALERALLELAGLDAVPSRRRRAAATAPLLPQVRDVGQSALSKLLDRAGADVFVWLANDVVALADAPIESRVAAAEALVGRYRDDTLTALLQAAKSDEAPLFNVAALDALAGWPSAEVTDFLLGGLELSVESAGRTPVHVFQSHLHRLGEASRLSDETQERILEFVQPRLVSENWRTASRALELVGPISIQPAYPALIEALETWAARRAQAAATKRPGKNASRRIENDIVDELRRKSGREIGNHPERWRYWWSLVESGKVAPPSEQEEETSAASFFSLRPVTDRVTFIIDRSGSMSARFAESTRYESAMQQTLDYLQVSGETTLFNVFLFSSETLRYKNRLQQATPRNLKALQKWLAYNGPEGATHLKDAVLAALEIGRRGEVNLDKLESDTVIVLCDGATIAGPDWVEGLLGRINDRARVVFHCVQLGEVGDGTLEALSRATGGDFIHIPR